MRTLISFLIPGILMLSPVISFCQVSTTEAEKHMKLASDYIKAKNYVEAFNELGKAKIETQKLVTAQLEKIFPATIDNWTLVKEQPTSLPTGGMAPIGMAGTQNYISITKNYQQPKQETAPSEGTLPSAAMYMQPGIMVTVSNDTFTANNVKMAYSNQSTMPPIAGQEIKPVEIKGYKATASSNTYMKMSSITILTGKGVVQIHGTQIENPEVLMKLAEALDLNAVAETFGK